MGYSVDASGDLTIKVADVPAAVAAVRKAWRDAEADLRPDDRLGRGNAWGWSDAGVMTTDEPIGLDEVLNAAGFGDTQLTPGEECIPPEPGIITVTVYHGDSMDSDALGEALAACAPWVTGDVDCRGEDDCLWRWHLADGEFTEQSGKVVWE